MLKALLLFITIYTSGIAVAQQHKVYYDNNWEISGKKKASYYRESVKTGSLYKTDDYYINGQLYRTGYRYNIEFESSIYRIGHYVFYDEAGHKIREGDYDNGRRTGTWKYYYKSPENMKTEDHYKNDTLTGHSFIYDSASHRALSEKEYTDGRETKSWQYKGDDTVLTMTRYTGKDYEKIEFYKNNQVKKKTLFEAGNSPSTDCYDEEGKKVACDTVAIIPGKRYSYVERMPSSHYDLKKYLAENINYPKAARKQGIQGRVIVKFIVDEDGTISNVHLEKGIGSGCDEEAIRVVTDMPVWNPGLQNGIPVRVFFTLPIVFKLES